MERTLSKAAAQLGITRKKLIDALRQRGLIDSINLPAYPSKDRQYLRVKESTRFHPTLGMQYSLSIRVTQSGIH